MRLHLTSCQTQFDNVVETGNLGACPRGSSSVGHPTEAAPRLLLCDRQSFAWWLSSLGPTRVFPPGRGGRPTHRQPTGLAADSRVTHMIYDATVVDTYRITPRVQGLRLQVPDHEFDYEPGQHTTVRFDSAGEEVVRPYTPTNLPGSNQLALTVRRYDDGLASSYLHQKRPGDTVRLGPVEGSLTLADPDRDVAFLASGTGLTPMMAMLRQYLREGTGNAHVVYGDRREETLIHRETLNELAANHSNLRVAFTLSDPNWEWTGRVGYVQDHLSALFDSFDARDYYVCGVPPMVVQTKARLAELGAPDARVHTEGWEDGAVED